MYFIKLYIIFANINQNYEFMVITTDECNLLNKLSMLICDFYDLEQDFFTQKDRRSTNITKATYILMHIAHYKFNISSSKLSIFTQRTKRSVFRNISNAINYMNIYSDISDEYNEIITLIKYNKYIKEEGE